MLRGKTTPKNRLKFTSISGFAILTALATVSTASAQIQTSEIIEGDDGVDEVIVTVERRAQSLQDYAGTAAAISGCLLYTSPSPRDQRGSRMPSSA